MPKTPHKNRLSFNHSKMQTRVSQWSASTVALSNGYQKIYFKSILVNIRKRILMIVSINYNQFPRLQSEILVSWQNNVDNLWNIKRYHTDCVWLMCGLSQMNANLSLHINHQTHLISKQHCLEFSIYFFKNIFLIPLANKLSLILGPSNILEIHRKLD
jgi:hypothetical protein